MTTRVLLVDDHRLLAESLAIALRAEGFDASVALLGDRDALIAQVVENPPGLVLLDLDLGGAIGDGSSLVRPFTDAGSRVLVVSGTADPVWPALAVEQGALGLVNKQVPYAELLRTVLAAARGEEVLPPGERQRLLADLRADRRRRQHLLGPFQRLTPREQQVLRALADGEAVARIAERSVVSEATVRTQVRGVLTKLSVGSQLEAVAAALRAGWL